MELSNEQVQRIVEAVMQRIGGVRAEPAPGSGSTVWPSTPPMVQLPPEFYESQRVVAERVARLEERFEQVDKRFSTMQWTIGIGFTLITVLMSAYNFVG